MGNGEKQANSSKAMTTTGTSTGTGGGSYAAGESVDFIKSSGNGSHVGTALLDASLANDSSQEWEGNELEDSGSLLRKQKPILQQQNYNAAAVATANLQMVRVSARVANFLENLALRGMENGVE